MFWTRFHFLTIAVLFTGCAQSNTLATDTSSAVNNSPAPIATPASVTPNPSTDPISQVVAGNTFMWTRRADGVTGTITYARDGQMSWTRPGSGTSGTGKWWVRNGTILCVRFNPNSSGWQGQLSCNPIEVTTKGFNTERSVSERI